jgi:rhodanese-related sulfurtransferase
MTQAAPKIRPDSKQTTYSGWNSHEDKAKATKTAGPAQAASVSPSTLAEWQAKFPHLSVLGAKSAWDDKKTVFLDARKPEDYSEGHITGAVNFYAEEFDEWAPKILPGLDVHKTYVIYCNGTTCDLSHHLAERLSEQGFQNVKVFFNGWSEWTKAGYPATKGATP